MVVKLAQHKQEDGASPKARVTRLIRYIGNPTDEDKNEKCYLTFALNALGNDENILDECLAACLLAKRGGNAFEHIIISWPENETPTASEAKDICSIFLKELNPGGLAFCGLHVNTENLHVHMAVQKYRYDGSNSIFDKNENLLFRLHACLGVAETIYKFSQATNPLVYVANTGNGWSYKINSAPRSVMTLRPKTPDLLPVITDPHDFKMKKCGDFLYLPGESKPAIYTKDKYAVILQWWRKEIVDRIKDVPVHNIREREKVLGADGLIPLENIPVFLPTRKKKNIDEDYKSLFAEMSDEMHKSARREISVRRLLDMDYDFDEIEEYIRQKFERDRMTRLACDRMLASAKRRINRFREMIYTNNLGKKMRKMNGRALRLIHEENLRKRFRDTQRLLRKKRQGYQERFEATTNTIAVSSGMSPS